MAFAIGLYLPLSTTLPIFAGGAVKGYVDWRAERKGEKKEDDELGRGSLFATGLIAGGALTGVIVAILAVFYEPLMRDLNLEHAIDWRTRRKWLSNSWNPLLYRDDDYALPVGY